MKQKLEEVEEKPIKYILVKTHGQNYFFGNWNMTYKRININTEYQQSLYILDQLQIYYLLVSAL